MDQPASMRRGSLSLLKFHYLSATRPDRAIGINGKTCKGFPDGGATFGAVASPCTRSAEPEYGKCIFPTSAAPTRFSQAA
jgi:hypothetical protein